MIIGKIPYLNCVPFFNSFDVESDELCAATPRQLGKMLLRGDLDAGPVPVVEWFRVKEEYDLLDGWGIISDGSSNSVFLFSKDPISKLNDKRVFLTNHSLSSIALLKYLSRAEGVASIEWRDGEEPGKDDARLMIGDAAMEGRPLLERQGFTAIDLSKEWKLKTGLPFTFAVWVVRKDVPEKNKQRLSSRIRASHDDTIHRISVISNEQAAIRRLPQHVVKNYLESFIYRHTSETIKGMNLFEEQLDSELIRSGTEISL